MLNIVTGLTNIVITTTTIILSETEKAQLKELEDKVNALNDEYNKIGIDLKPLIDLFEKANPELIDLQADGAKLDLILNEAVDPLAKRISQNANSLQSKLQTWTFPNKTDDGSKSNLMSALQYTLTGLGLFIATASFVKNVYDYNKSNSALSKDPKAKPGSQKFGQNAIDVEEGSVNHTIKGEPQDVQIKVKSRTKAPSSSKKWLQKAFGWDKTTTTGKKVMSVVGAVFDIVSIALGIYTIVTMMKQFQVAKDQLQKQIKDMNEAIEQRKAELPQLKELLASQSVDLPTFFVSIDKMKEGLGESLAFLIPFSSELNAATARAALLKLNEIKTINEKNLQVYEKYANDTEKVTKERNENLKKKSDGDTSQALQQKIDQQNQEIINSFQSILMASVSNEAMVNDIKVAKDAYHVMVEVANNTKNVLSDISSMVALVSSLSDPSTYEDEPPQKFLFNFFKKQFKSLLDLTITEKDLALCFVLFTDYKKNLGTSTFLGIDLDALKKQCETEGLVLDQAAIDEIKKRFETQAAESSSTNDQPQPANAKMMRKALKTNMMVRGTPMNKVQKITFSSYLAKSGVQRASSQINLSEYVTKIQQAIKDLEKQYNDLSSLRSNLQNARPAPFDIADIFTLGLQQIGKKLLNDDIDTAQGKIDYIQPKVTSTKGNYNTMLNNSSDLYLLATSVTFFEKDLRNLGVLTLANPNLNVDFFNSTLNIFQKINTVLSVISMIAIDIPVIGEILIALVGVLSIAIGIADLVTRRDKVNEVIGNLNSYDRDLSVVLADTGKKVSDILEVFAQCAQLLVDVSGKTFSTNSQVVREIYSMNELMKVYFDYYYASSSSSEGNYKFFKMAVKQYEGQTLYGYISGDDFFDVLWMRDFVPKQNRDYFLVQNKISADKAAKLLKSLSTMDSLYQGQDW